MGYRSDVTIIIYGDTKDVVAFVASEKLKGKPKDIDFHPLDEKTDDNYHEKNQYTYGGNDEFMMLEFNWWDVKWYDSYPEVEWWQDIAGNFEQGYASLSMELAIVGESVDDNRTDYYGENCEYMLNISREITKNLP